MNPFTRKFPSEEREEQAFAFYIAEVIEMQEDEDRVIVVPRGHTQAAPHPVALPSLGDAVYYEEGTRVIVLVGQGSRKTIVGVLNDDFPDIEYGERVIGHGFSNTEIRFKDNGDVEINPDRTITIDGRDILDELDDHEQRISDLEEE